ncbi:MAG: LysM peptidoglycan-binding domain-containing protein [Chlamydiota bacterium]
MSRSAQENIWVRRVRLLTQLLILSGTVNIGLFATFVYFVLRDSQDSISVEMRSSETSAQSPEISNEKILSSYSTLSFQDLLLRLENKELVEEGYMKRDLALASLVAFHHFNLERALGGLTLQQRKIVFSDDDGEVDLMLTIFPGLADYQFQAIIHYAKTEKWPFTSQGLFFALKRKEEKRDSTLVDAFSLTPEFHIVFTLFNRSGMPLPKEILIALIADGEWDLFSRFVKEQKQSLDLTAERRRAFLLEWMNVGSDLAVHLFFRFDIEFISKRFSDEQVLKVVHLVDERTPGFLAFAKELLTSPRSDAVRERAAHKLYAMAGEPVPDPYDHTRALERFAPELSLNKKIILEKEQEQAEPTAVVLPKKYYYTILPGDSLWKIARQYNTTIDAIMRLNKLESERLRPGKTLEIPK